MVLSIIGGIGGLVGIWAAVATVNRDRPRITVELEFCRAVSPNHKEVQMIGPIEDGRDAYYLTAKIRNVGHRPAFLEDVEFEYRGGSGETYWVNTPCDVVLEDTRRSHTIFLDLSYVPDDRPVELAITDHRGIKHRTRLVASRVTLRLYERAQRLLPHGVFAQLDTIASLDEFFADESRDPFRPKRPLVVGSRENAG